MERSFCEGQSDTLKIKANINTEHTAKFGHDLARSIINYLSNLLILITFLAISASVFSEPTSSDTSVSSLNEERKKNEQAQTEYYQKLKSQLKDTSHETFWEKILDNPASVLSVLGVFVAAIVTLFSFFFNYRATLRYQRDTQFYEALKRFGEKDSPTMRSSAAGLISHMAKMERLIFQAKYDVSKGGRRRHFSLAWEKSYFDTSLNQLNAGLLFEENEIVLNSIFEAINELTIVEPYKVLKKMYSTNQALQYHLFIEISKISANSDSKDLQDALHIASLSTGYHQNELAVLANRMAYNLSEVIERDKQIYLGINQDKKIDNLIMAQSNLQIIARRLERNIRLCTVSMKQTSKQKVNAIEQKAFDLDFIFLVGGDLTDINFGPRKFKEFQINMHGAQLQRCDLRKTQLKDIDLSYSSLDDALLYRAYGIFDSKLEGANWWKANFYEYGVQNSSVDDESLGELCGRYGDPQTQDLHPSVSKFMDKWRKSYRTAISPD